MVHWQISSEQAEADLMRRSREMQGKFRSCDIYAELADQSTIIQLCNLFANPAYVHLEDSDFETTIPFLK